MYDIPALSNWSIQADIETFLSIDDEDVLERNTDALNTQCRWTILKIKHPTSNRDALIL